MSLEKFEDTKKLLSDKISDVMLRMRDFEQKSDPSALFETHIQAIKNMNDKISALERSLVYSASSIYISPNIISSLEQKSERNLRGKGQASSGDYFG